MGYGTLLSLAVLFVLGSSCTAPANARAPDLPMGRERAGAGGVSRPGGAGHALLFRDHVLLKTDFKNFPRTALTFEAWISTSDFCHAGTLLSYAKDSRATSEAERVRDFNHFVVFDPRNLLACHDYQYIDMFPDPRNVSCHAAFAAAEPHGSRTTASAVERDGSWHHVAVTWDAAQQGLTNIYLDGLLMASSTTQQTEPLVPNGALMIGGEQDCYGGCTDPGQGFHGLLDEVRLWRVARSQADILRTMRLADGLQGTPGLVAWWQFNEPDQDGGQFRHHVTAMDRSGMGNHLSLETVPRVRPAVISGAPGVTRALQLRNNFAMSRSVVGMPRGSFTVEMWAQGAPVAARGSTTQPRAATLLSYATQRVDTATGEPVGFMDDAVRIERVLADVAPAWLEPLLATSTAGAVVLHLNSNEHADVEDREACWVYFDARWLDDGWHHLALSWDADIGADGSGGAVTLLFDGAEAKPFWKSDRRGVRQSANGVDPSLVPPGGASRQRGGDGALVLGQDQDCFGGCFSPSDAFFGEVAAVRVWRRARSADETRRNMGRAQPDDATDLAALYTFEDGVVVPVGGEGGAVVRDTAAPNATNHLLLRGSPPLYTYSTAPLAFSDGRPVAPPSPGAAGYSLALSDQQVLLHTGFTDFPSTELTVEFWMWSVDTCRPGVPFSYAAGPYAAQDNAFLLFNYNSWGVAVMEDEGTLGDHLSGVAATDGNWHHVAVTWRSDTGRVVLYDNGRPVWMVTRGKGKAIPSGGTLVVGREQDCPGGCFDSATGATGRISPVTNQEYGPQDFTGVIEEMRLWRVARTGEQIRAGMAADDGRGPGGFRSPGVDPGHADLVAYWKFDEGAGYTARDTTGHGHDLMLARPPSWLVTRWLSTCGNAVVEGREECDDGDHTDGDGCSAACTVEDGWECSEGLGGLSVCKRRDRQQGTGQAPPTPPQPQPQQQPSPQPPQRPVDPSAPLPSPVPPAAAEAGVARQQQRRGHGWAIAAAGVVVSTSLVLLAVLGMIARRRHGGQGSGGSILPLSTLRDALLGWRRPHSIHGYMRLAECQGDNDGDPAAAPDFMAVSPAPASSRSAATTAPGSLGPYQSLVGSPTV